MNRSPSPLLIASRPRTGARKTRVKKEVISDSDDSDDVVILPTPVKPPLQQVTLDSQNPTQVSTSQFHRDLARNGSNFPSTSRSRMPQPAQKAKTSKLQRKVCIPSLNNGYQEAEPPTSGEEGSDDEEYHPTVWARRSPPPFAPEVIVPEEYRSRSSSPVANANQCASRDHLPLTENANGSDSDEDLPLPEIVNRSDSDEDLPLPENVNKSDSNEDMPLVNNENGVDSDSDSIEELATSRPAVVAAPIPYRRGLRKDGKPRRKPIRRPKPVQESSDSDDETEIEKYTGEDADFSWLFQTDTAEEAANAAEKNSIKMKRYHDELKSKPFKLWETRGMLWWLLKNKYVTNNKSNRRWMEMIDEGYLGHRTHISLLNCYARTIVRDLASGKFGAPAVIKKKYK